MKIDIPDVEEAQYEDVWLGSAGPFRFKIGKVAGMANAYRKAFTVSEEEAGYLVLDQQMMWLERGFDPDVWRYINERLLDDDDPLDYPHMAQMFKDLFSLASGRPTISPNGASAQRSARPVPQDHLPPVSESRDSTPANSATSYSNG